MFEFISYRYVSDTYYHTFYFSREKKKKFSFKKKNRDSKFQVSSSYRYVFQATGYGSMKKRGSKKKKK